MRAPLLIALLAAAPAHAAKPVHVGAVPFAVGDEGELVGSMQADMTGEVDGLTVHVQLQVLEAVHWRVLAVGADGRPSEVEATWDNQQIGVAAGTPLELDVGPLYGKTVRFVRGEDGALTPPPEAAAALEDVHSFVTTPFDSAAPAAPVDLVPGKPLLDLVPVVGLGNEVTDLEVVGLRRRAGQRVVEIRFAVSGLGSTPMPARMWLDPRTGRMEAMLAEGEIEVSEPGKTMHGVVSMDVTVTPE